VIGNLRWIGILGAVVVAGAMTSVAQAADPDDRPGIRGPGAVDVSGLVQSADPDDRPGIRGPGAVPVDVEGGTLLTVPSVTLPTAADGGFQWEDATLGAGAMLATVLLAAGLAVSFRHRRRVSLP
jgi:hypothetical protein